MLDWLPELDASDWIEAAAALITLVGAVLVLLQLRILNQQTRLQNFAEYTGRYQQIVLNFPEDINASNFSLAERKAKSNGDYPQVMRYMRAYYDLCFEEWYLHRKGLIEDDFWSVWLDGIKIAVSKPSFQQAWAVMQADTNYGPHFSNFIQQLIEATRKRGA